jgi:hypothetical protein
VSTSTTRRGTPSALVALRALSRDVAGKRA